MTDFTEKDKQEAERLIVQRFPYSRPADLLEYQIERLKDQLAFPYSAGITSFLHYLKSDFIYFGIARRIVSGDIGMMTECLRSSARAGYLLYVAGGEKYSGDNDSLHAFELLKMLAVGDMQAVDALSRRYPAPFNKGHLDTITLCNALYLALGKHPDPDSVIAAMKSRKSTKFFTSMYRCVTAILEQDSEAFSQHLIELLKGNRRQDFHSSMEKTICLEAHAMMRLWLFRNEAGLPELAGFELPWDRELHCLTQNPTAMNLPDFATVSPVMDRWIKEMPYDVDANELAIELKESLLQRLIRRVRVVRRKNKLNKSIRSNK